MGNLTLNGSSDRRNTDTGDTDLEVYRPEKYGEGERADPVMPTNTFLFIHVDYMWRGSINEMY